MSIILAFDIFFQIIFCTSFWCNKDFMMPMSLFVLRAHFVNMYSTDVVNIFEMAIKTKFYISVII